MLGARIVEYWELEAGLTGFDGVPRESSAIGSPTVILCESAKYE